VEYKVSDQFSRVHPNTSIDATFRDPAAVKNAYTENSIWRNRDTFLKGHDAIVDFLTKKWAKENGYRLRKELFAFQDNKVGDLVFLLRPKLAGLQL
jgi:nuclear transport factor 2 (NTF2) superfamily protein